MVWASIFTQACYDRRYSHIADGVIENKTLWQSFWESTHLRCCNTISHRFCNDTVNNVTPLRYDNVVTLLCYVVHNVAATFLGVYRFSLPKHFCNDIVILTQRSHNLELLAGIAMH